MNVELRNPADIYRQLAERADTVIREQQKRNNLEIIIDLHWFYLHSREYKQRHNIGKYIGKWKYDALSDEDLLFQAQKLLAFVALGYLPVYKFTNVANAPGAKKIIAVYCYPGWKSKDEVEQILIQSGLTVRWSGDKYRRP